MLKRRGNDRFQVVLTWNTGGVFVGSNVKRDRLLLYNFEYIFLKTLKKMCAHFFRNQIVFEILNFIG